MAGRNSQVARILCILDLLDSTPGGLSVAEVHAKVTERGHEAEKRTVYRDIEALSQAGFPLFPNGGANESGIRWKLDRSARVGQYLVLSARELFALFIARGALKPLSHTPFFEDIQTLFQKLEEKLGLKNSEYLKALDQEMKFEPTPHWGLGLNPDVLETVRAACAEGHTIECVYFSVNTKKETTRKLGPHYLYYAKGGLYLVAEDLEAKKVKVFALPRMKEALMLDEEYKGTIHTPDEIFDGALSVYTTESSKEVVIDFDENIAQYVKERRWHASQRLVNRDHGMVRVTLEVGETPELIAWILGFGPNAKVVSPTSLAEKVAVKAMETAKIYLKEIG